MNAMISSFRQRIGYDDWDASRRLIVLCGVALLVLFVWAGLARVDEVTRGMGKVVPSSKAQLVQAASPATVLSILVRPGQMVKKGQLLVRLDDSQSSSALGQLQAENERLAARADRLEGEGTGTESSCGEGTICAEEARLADVRRAAAQSRQNALVAQVDQRRRDLQEGQATVASLQNSAKLAQDQVNMLTPLAQKGIVPKTELLTAQRDLVDTQGRLSAARQGVGRAQAAIREAEAQLRQARLDFQQEALNERSEITTKIAVNEETIKGAEARLERNELRAPATGYINDVQVTTVGGFVNAGEKLMQIVPVGEKLLVEARVDPKDIAFIKVGDPANVKVTAYDFSIYGGLTGRVRNISADSIYDDVERKAYYSVMVETDKAFIVKNGTRLPIMPGMICDVEIVTGRKSILTYLFKPVLRAFDEALTER
ncbi:MULTISPECIES: HlyD family type I secretion periplasmic adaptor subunit [Novosphingobium]|uniref:Membrane fusion protein (MFP) family protein n=1 Tax=Novosphingobium pentaromativorans US6-1 TaxID=1088721 RepID=G6EIT2_9SPHN|nr:MULTISPECIES: HlyD family type I secretion periplasmic adaptor subunit [Novosphingobium]EHJ58691.1 type I secretion membrane fusion protein, HlyD [Novosphingobium pentaromativorans US6-1]GFM29427.1 type I secretion membrane fusion protein, HlyD [Novosphingobium sp. PY1]